MKRLVAIGFVVASFGLVFGLATGARAAETHGGCVTFLGPLLLNATFTASCTLTISSATGLSMIKPVTNPCTKLLGLLTLSVSHSIFHVNVNAAGDAWLTGTISGKAAVVPTGGLTPTLTGAWSTWFGAQLNRNNLVLSFTFNVSLSGPSGHVTVHGGGHFRLTPKGALLLFLRLKFTFTCH